MDRHRDYRRLAAAGRSYRWELHRRETAGKIPADVRYVVVPDLGDESMGTGGDSRRLPQYSLSGKLFSVVLSVERHG